MSALERASQAWMCEQLGVTVGGLAQHLWDCRTAQTRPGQAAALLADCGV